MRVFVAAWPSSEMARQLRRLDRPARTGVRWTTADQWHVTLRFLGVVDDVEVLHRALGGLGSLPAVTAEAGPAARWLGSSVLCLPVAGIDGLASAVAEATRGLGDPPPDRPFQGHLTLARAHKDVDPRPLTPILCSACWPVSELTLVASTLHRAGVEYQVIGRYPLTPPG